MGGLNSTPTAIYFVEVGDSPHKKGQGIHFQSNFSMLTKNVSEKKNWVTKGGNDGTREWRNEGTTERWNDRTREQPSETTWALFKNPVCTEVRNGRYTILCYIFFARIIGARCDVYPRLEERPEHPHPSAAT